MKIDSVKNEIILLAQSIYFSESNLVIAEYGSKKSTICRFCYGEFNINKNDAVHDFDCPVTLAGKILKVLHENPSS